MTAVNLQMPPLAARLLDTPSWEHDIWAMFKPAHLRKTPAFRRNPVTGPQPGLGR